MSTPEALAWLRQQIEGDKAAAGEARGDGDGHWWRREHGQPGGPYPLGALFEGEPVVDDPGHDIFIAEVVVYDEGRPSDAQFAHIALHDPLDTIADCEAKLAILDAEYALTKTVTCLLASAYRHRRGYVQHWGVGGIAS